MLCEVTPRCGLGPQSYYTLHLLQELRMCALLYDLAGFHNLGCPHEDMCSRLDTPSKPRYKNEQQHSNAQMQAGGP